MPFPSDRARSFAVAVALLIPGAVSVRGGVLWTDPEPRVIHNTPDGADLLGGAVKRDDKADDALYFKFKVDPLSDVDTEEYYAAFQLFVGNGPRLAIGNAPEAWGYSAFNASETGRDNKRPGEFNLNSAKPEAGPLGAFKSYELPYRNHERVIVFKVQYVPDGDDLVTVWLNPDLTHGGDEQSLPEALTTKFKADASFDQIRLRHEGEGNGWRFSEMAIATSFKDFVTLPFWRTWWFAGLCVASLLASVLLGARIVEKRKYQRRLLIAEKERAVERERARIAQDLHDELGSYLTRLSLMSDSLVEYKGDPDQVESRSQRITQTSNETVRALEEIVWALRPGSDTLQSLVEYIAHFAKELFEGSQTRCRLDLPDDLPKHSLPPNMRHNIFLIVKEALTNALKHAEASEIQVQAKTVNATLAISIMDDGKGFDFAAASQSQSRNGLGNMQRRSEQMGGQLDFASHPGRGTVVTVRVQLPDAMSS